MSLIKINGSTSYYPAPNNVGVFSFKDKYTLLIDSGSTKAQAHKIDDDLKALSLLPKYIFLTHHHGDHTTGSAYYKDNYPGCQYFAAPSEKMFMENPELFSFYTYGGFPENDIAKHLGTSPKIEITEALTEGQVKINNEKFTVLNLPGHSIGMSGIITRDRVAFLGDALFSEEIIKKYGCPYLFNIEQEMQTYENLSTVDADYFVLAHGEKIYAPEEMPGLIAANKQVVADYIEMTEELLIQSKTREELLEELIILNDLNPDYKEYHLLAGTVAAIISYLHHEKHLSWVVENGRLFYYRE